MDDKKNDGNQPKKLSLKVESLQDLNEAEQAEINGGTDVLSTIISVAVSGGWVIRSIMK